MSNAVSVLNGASFSGEVTITEAGLRGMITLRGDLNSEPIRDAVVKATGLSVPDQRKIVLSDQAGVAWMSPDELLLMVDYEAVAETISTLKEALAGLHFLAVDVSDARVVFSITGAGGREVLAKGAPVDLAHSAFQQGDFRRTRLGQVAVAFWMTDAENFELVCFRSLGDYMFKWLSTAGRKDSLPHYF